MHTFGPVSVDELLMMVAQKDIQIYQRDKELARLHGELDGLQKLFAADKQTPKAQAEAT